jgi:exodeoxyribonuclease-5
MIVSEEQKEVIRNVLKNINNNQFLGIGGLAGTGKSTIIKILRHKLKNWALGAYTGKAANVLRQKGNHDARTIHNLIYYPAKTEEEETIWLRYPAEEIPYEGFIIDEASMVGKEIHEDLLSFNKPIIYIGDHGQLEPIGSKFNLMKDPDYKLETIHRNAGEIAHFAEHLRKGKNPNSFKSEKKVKIIKKNVLKDSCMAKAEQVICAFNKTRANTNEKIRKSLGLNEMHIAINEKIICLKNNRRLQLFNGMQGIVKELHTFNRFSFVSGDILYHKIPYDHNQFGKEKNDFEFQQEDNPFDYAYAITAHKAQGDSFSTVIVLEEKCDMWNHTRWAYTAASRAKNILVWAQQENYLPNYLTRA